MKIAMNTEYSLSWLDRELRIIRKCWSPLVILYKHSHYNGVYSNAFFHLLPIAWFLRWNGESNEIWCGSSVDPEYTNISFQESGLILGHDFIILKITLAKSQHWWSCKCKSECSKSQWYCFLCPLGSESERMLWWWLGVFSLLILVPVCLRCYFFYCQANVTGIICKMKKLQGHLHCFERLTFSSQGVSPSLKAVIYLKVNCQPLVPPLCWPSSLSWEWRKVGNHVTPLVQPQVFFSENKETEIILKESLSNTIIITIATNSCKKKSLRPSFKIMGSHFIFKWIHATQKNNLRLNLELFKSSEPVNIPQGEKTPWCSQVGPSVVNLPMWGRTRRRADYTSNSPSQTYQGFYNKLVLHLQSTHGEITTRTQYVEL